MTAKHTALPKDAHGNRCSVEYFGSREAAQAALDSLKNCVDAMLAQELSRVFINLVSSQRELDRDAKRALYGNLRRLYCR